MFFARPFCRKLQNVFVGWGSKLLDNQHPCDSYLFFLHIQLVYVIVYVSNCLRETEPVPFHLGAEEGFVVNKDLSGNDGSLCRLSWEEKDEKYIGQKNRKQKFFVSFCNYPHFADHPDRKYLLHHVRGVEGESDQCGAG